MTLDLQRNLSRIRPALLGLAVFLVASLGWPHEAFAQRRVGLEPGFRSGNRSGHFRGRGRGYYGVRPYYYSPFYYGYGGIYDPFGFGFGFRGRRFPLDHSHHGHQHYGPHSHGGEVHSHGGRTPTAKGWALFAKGDRKRALSTFAKQAKRDANNTSAKLGYALSAAELGNLDLASMAMRRAARSDASGLLEAPLDGALETRVRALIETFHPREHASEHDADAHFMAAALLFVAGDLESAQTAARYAAAQGDQDASTRQLERAIASALDAQREALGDATPETFEPPETPETLQPPVEREWEDLPSEQSRVDDF